MESGLQFDFTYASGTTWEQMLAFETAGLMWSDYISDDMTVNIHVEMTNTLPDNVIGGALPGMVADVDYSDFRNAYRNDIKSWRDRRDYNSLSLLREGSGGIGSGGTQEKFEALVNLGGSKYLENSAELNMTRANAKALGLIAGDNAILDGYILMSDLSGTSLNWDYNREWTNSSSLDFLSTAIHEVGHILGFVSGVDKYQGVKFYDNSSFWNHFGTFDTFKGYLNDILDYANPLDLFRYSQESIAIKNGRNTIDMSIGTQTYFGPAQLWDAYATGKETSLDGDGFQASHWKQNDDDNWMQGIMDPLMKPGVIRRISDRDLRAMDSIGYDVTGNGEKLLAMNNKANNWRVATGQGTNFGILQWRAKDHLAKSRYSNGQVSWLEDWMKNKPWKASEMTSERTWDVDRMIDRSQVYNARRSSGRRTTYRQEIFWQEAYFSTIANEYAATPAMSNLDSTFTFISLPIFEISPDSSTALVLDRLSDTATSETKVENKIDVGDVAIDLLSLSDVGKLISTLSTQLKTELIEDSLYQEQLVESELLVALV